MLRSKWIEYYIGMVKKLWMRPEKAQEMVQRCGGLLKVENLDKDGKPEFDGEGKPVMIDEKQEVAEDRVKAEVMERVKNES